MADTEHGKITDEGVAKLRTRIGKGFEGRRPWRTEVTRDAIYHLAYAIGDLSPMYLDDDYAARSVSMLWTMMGGASSVPQRDFRA